MTVYRSLCFYFHVFRVVAPTGPISNPWCKVPVRSPSTAYKLTHQEYYDY